MRYHGWSPDPIYIQPFLHPRSSLSHRSMDHEKGLERESDSQLAPPVQANPR